MSPKLSLKSGIVVTVVLGDGGVRKGGREMLPGWNEWRQGCVCSVTGSCAQWHVWVAPLSWPVENEGKAEKLKEMIL